LRYIDDLVLRENGEERLYSLADPNWNVVAICDTSGDIQERYTYDAFGKRNVFDAIFTAKAGTVFNWDRAFTGQVIDIETGLMLYRKRYYSTNIGRFISKDPLEYRVGEINTFRYVCNNATNLLDQFGLEIYEFTFLVPVYYQSPIFLTSTSGFYEIKIPYEYTCSESGDIQYTLSSSSTGNLLGEFDNFIFPLGNIIVAGTRFEHEFSVTHNKKLS
jgi:RHS repeat-associated protein